MLTNNIRVSVVIPCFNHGQYIMDAIESVEACEDQVFEIVIVNDGSTDPYTLEVIENLEQEGYFVVNQQNQGLGAARNNGIEVATGEYILPLDSDNKIRPDYIRKSIEILDQFPEVGVVYGNANYFGEKTGLWKIQEFNLQKLLLRNFIDACAVFRKSIWKSYKYDEEMPLLGWEDWDFWLGVAEAGWQFYYIPEVLFDYRVRTGSMISECKVDENRKLLDEYVSRKHAVLIKSQYEKLLKEHERVLEKNRSLHCELQKLREFMSFSFLIYPYKLYRLLGRTYQKIKPQTRTN